MKVASDLLNIIHWVVACILLFPMFIPNKTVKLWSYGTIVVVLASWIVFNGCVIWDIQKMVDPTFVISRDTVGTYIGVSNETWAYVNAILTYTNLLVLGSQLGRLPEAITIFLIYLALNGRLLAKPFTKILSRPTE